MRKLCLLGCIFLLSKLVHGQTNERTICEGTSVGLSAQSAGASSFEWFRNGQLISGTTGNTLTVWSEGKYSAMALMENGCKSDASFELTVKYHVPNAVNDVVTGLPNTEIEIDLLQNDKVVCASMNRASLQVVRAPFHGNLVSRSDKLVYRSESGFSGVDSFTYKFKDVNGKESNEGIVQLNIGAALPVTIVNFTAEKQESKTLLNWTTAAETNSEKFEIERSADAKTWNKIDEVKAANSSNALIDYHYTDVLPQSGANYYRLKAVDLDGKFAYSRVQVVHFPEFPWATLYPNPTAGVLQVTIRSKRVTNLKLVSLSGQVLLSGPVDKQLIKLDMTSFVAGIYFIQLTSDNGSVKAYKFMRE